MGENLGEAVLYLRTDDSELVGGMAKAKGDAQGLAGTFQSSSGVITGSLAGVGASATQMAANAQTMARAATGGAAAMGTLGTATHASSLQIREMLVLMREASVGNFTRMAGSASILAGSLANTGTSIGGLVRNLLTMVRVLKVTQDAELAEEAASAAAAHAALQAVADRAATNIVVADTQLALAEATVRAATTAEEEAAAQAQLGLALEAVSAAADQATIAQNALAVAHDRAAAAAEAEAATTVVGLGAVGTALAVVLPIVGLLAAAFEGVKQSADDLDPGAKKYIATLDLTDKQIRRLKDTTVTWGDTAKATWDVLLEKAGLTSAGVSKFFSDAFRSIADFGKFSVAIIVAAFAAGARAVQDIWAELPALIGEASVGAANLAIGAIQNLINFGIRGINRLADMVNSSLLGSAIEKVFGTELPRMTDVSLGHIKNSFSGTFAEVGRDVSNTLHGTFNAVENTFNQISAKSNAIRDQRLAAQAKLIKGDDDATAATNRHTKALEKHAKAAKDDAEAVASLADQLQQLLDKLFPEDVKFREQVADIALLDKALAAGIISWNKYADAVARAMGQQSALQPSDDILNAKPLSKLDVPDLKEALDQLPKLTAATDQWKQALSDLRDIGKNVLKQFNDGFATLLTSSRSFADFWKGLKGLIHDTAMSALQDLIKLAAKEAEMAALKAIFGGGTDFSSLFGGAHALGGLIPAGTFGIVGEKGPEPVIATPRGAMVLPNSSMRQGTAANDRSPVFAPVFNNDFRGADANAVAAIEARQDRFEREFQANVIGAWGDSSGRFVFKRRSW